VLVLQMIFWGRGGLVLAIDDEMPLACAQLAGKLNYRDSLGFCCFGEQGTAAQGLTTHGNLMFGPAVFFANAPAPVSTV